MGGGGEAQRSRAAAAAPMMPPPPRLLRDVRNGYPRLSGSGGRGQLRPLRESGPARQARWRDLAQGARGAGAGGWAITALGLEREREPARARATSSARPLAPARARASFPGPPALRPHVARHQTGSSRVQDGDAAVRAPGRAGAPLLAARARSRGPTKNSRAPSIFGSPDSRRPRARPTPPRLAPPRAAPR